ncbi:DNA endonuclease RBBP8 isoform X1 [Alosa sapidissima]|uniref:DNA endonuclease RBBP8 isoform X1 n=2 Tax=Alosa sapidissima TaxID=34773 RepID=UPI001C09DE50|nr:DNA endonuclease RBBP8 isoform X1 [Alosa sapidissima]
MIPGPAVCANLPCQSDGTQWRMGSEVCRVNVGPHSLVSSTVSLDFFSISFDSTNPELPEMMSSPDLSGGSPGGSSVLSDSGAADLFHELWGRLRECHDSALQGLQAKVTKLKKERCLDAQRLEEFYNKNQLLREQQKVLQDNVKVLEDRLRAGLCDRCAVTEKHMKKKQMEFGTICKENQLLISDLRAERDSLQEENKRLNLQLERLQECSSPQAVSSEAEDGMIPDSPLHSVTLSAISKMKRRKEHSHVRYAEQPLSQSTKGLSSSLPSRCYGKGILVPDTCEMDVNPITKLGSVGNGRVVVAETCHLDIPEEDSHSVLDSVAGSSAAPNASPDENKKPSNLIKADTSSPSLLRRISTSPHHLHRPQAAAAPRIAPLQAPRNLPSEPAKRKPTSLSSEEEEEGADRPLDLSPEERLEKRPRLAPQPKAPSRTTRPEESQDEDALFKQPTIQAPVRKKIREVLPDSEQTSVLQPNPCARVKSPLQETTEQSWSLDPGAALSQYHGDSPPLPETRAEPDTVDTDCTFLSHSMLIRARNGHNESGIGLRANDSLAEIFDRTAYGEYESCPRDINFEEEDKEGYEDKHDEDEGAEEDEEEKPGHEKACDPVTTAARKVKGTPKKSGEPGYAYVDVVRKRDERRKLKGHTCKECEIYYADLPEEEREKKLASCSRHRFRYIPPSTPENFWEVGFPSTQTCVERGYIKEDKEPDLRLRRRRPYVAMFSPKAKD